VATTDVSIVIDRPVEDVFAVLSAAEKTPEWSSLVLEAEKTSPDPVGLGSTARFVGKFLGRRVESELEVTEWEPDRRMTSDTKRGPFPLRQRFTFTPEGQGTRVDLTIDVESKGFFKVAEPLFVALGKRQYESDLATLKDLMEAGVL
jgi:uncharacterized protein YndB with AHSA1/START domain